MGLRLDREEGAKTALASGNIAIVPGSLEKSALYQRITNPDEQRRMPHISSGKERLSAVQIATLRRWIEEEAGRHPHRADLPPPRGPPPRRSGAPTAPAARGAARCHRRSHD